MEWEVVQESCESERNVGVLFRMSSTLRHLSTISSWQFSRRFAIAEILTSDMVHVWMVSGSRVVTSCVSSTKPLRMV